MSTLKPPPTAAIEEAFAAGPDTPPFVAVQTADGVTWLAIRDYGHRKEGLLDGTGCFVVFQSKNDAGEWGDWVMLNGGLIDRTKGREQGDLDILTVIDGKPAGVALVGHMDHAGGPRAGLLPTNNDQLNLGGPNNRYHDLYLAGLLDAMSIGVQINLGTEGQPNWQWRDCLPVRTQQGIRFMPVYACSPGSFPTAVKGGV